MSNSCVVPGYQFQLNDNVDWSRQVPPSSGRAFPLQNPAPRPLTENEKALQELQEMNSRASFILQFPLPDHHPSFRNRPQPKRSGGSVGSAPAPSSEVPSNPPGGSQRRTRPVEERSKRMAQPPARHTQQQQTSQPSASNPLPNPAPTTRTAAQTPIPNHLESDYELALLVAREFARESDTSGGTRQRGTPPPQPRRQDQPPQQQPTTPPPIPAPATPPPTIPTLPQQQQSNRDDRLNTRTTQPPFAVSNTTETTTGGGGGWQLRDFSYEALLELGSMAVPTGLSRQQLAKYVPQVYTARPGSASSSSAVTCSICLEDMAQGTQSLTIRCGHIFHYQCIIQWLSRANKCPTCRYEIPRNDKLK